MLIDISKLPNRDEQSDKLILMDILNYWIDHDQTIMNQTQDFSRVIEEYLRITGDKQYFELAAVVMGSNVLDRHGTSHEYWTLIKDLSYEYYDVEGNICMSLEERDTQCP